jgi:hypothetical protein
MRRTLSSGVVGSGFLDNDEKEVKIEGARENGFCVCVSLFLGNIKSRRKRKRAGRLFIT